MNDGWGPTSLLFLSSLRREREERSWAIHKILCRWEVDSEIKADRKVIVERILLVTKKSIQLTLRMKRSRESYERCNDFLTVTSLVSQKLSHPWLRGTGQSLSFIILYFITIPIGIRNDKTKTLSPLPTSSFSSFEERKRSEVGESLRKVWSRRCLHLLSVEP